MLTNMYTGVCRNKMIQVYMYIHIDKYVYIWKGPTIEDLDTLATFQDCKIIEKDTTSKIDYSDILCVCTVCNVM
jgi:hypothetical protein